MSSQQPNSAHFDLRIGGSAAILPENREICRSLTEVFGPLWLAPGDEVLDDLRHILRCYFPERDLATVKPLSKPTRLEQQKWKIRA